MNATRNAAARRAEPPLKRRELFMEQRLKSFLQDQSVRWTLLASLITAAAAYSYGMLNNIVNYDTIFNIPNVTGGGEASGRWALGLLTRLTERFRIGYSLPFFNTLVSLLLVALSAILICRILRLSAPRACALTGIVTMSFPAVASMTFFSFTMPYYALALVLITAACLLVERRRKPVWFLLYSLLLAFAVGVYQAFYPFAVMLAVLAVITECLDPKATPQAVLKQGLFYVGAILLSYLLYRLGLKAMLAATGRKLTAYQGIDQMGQIDLARLPGMLRDMYRHFFLLFTHDYLSLTSEPITRLCVLVLQAGSALLLVLGWREKNRLKRLELAVLLLVALPIASNLIILMVPDGTIYTLMAMGLLSVFLLPVLLWDRLRIPRPKLRRICGAALTALLLLTSLEYVYQSNGCYRVLEWHNIQTENYYTTLFTRIKVMEGYDENYPVIFSGAVISDASYHDPWSDTVFHYGGVRQFDSPDPENNGFNEFSRDHFIRSYLGYTARQIRSSEKKQYSDVLAQMRTYPNDGSIRIVNGVILVKFE